MILSHLGSQGTTQNDLVGNIKLSSKQQLGSLKGNAKHHQDAPKDNLRQHQVSPQKNFMLPQVQSHVCLWTSLACPKSQSQNPIALFVKGIGKLNLSPLGWLSHPHCHGASPWWSQWEVQPMWLKFTQKTHPLPSTAHLKWIFLLTKWHVAVKRF
jgi:hypothetical protein